MKWMSQEEIAALRQIDLLSFLQQKEPEELIRISDTVYTTRTHDSLKISNGKWFWWSRGIGGRSALDYLIKVRDMTFQEAVVKLKEDEVYQTSSSFFEKKEVVFQLPERNEDSQQAITYLFGRGIDMEIIENCIERGLIYESAPYHNVVFVGYDAHRKARYAMCRSTQGKEYKREVKGSEKAWAFRWEGKESCKRIHVFECAIDALSYASLCKMSRVDWTQEHLISLGGVYQPKEMETYKVPTALENFLVYHPRAEEVWLHLDNDMVGRGASQAIQQTLKKRIMVRNRPPLIGKDVNDMLCHRLGIKRDNGRDLDIASTEKG